MQTLESINSTSALKSLDTFPPRRQQERDDTTSELLAHLLAHILIRNGLILCWRLGCVLRNFQSQLDAAVTRPFDPELAALRLTI